MQQWWVDCYPAGLPREADSRTNDDYNDPFPIFHCRDLRTMQTVRPPTIVYPGLRLAERMCIYFAYLIIMSTIDTRPECSVILVEKYQLGCDIARSLQCYDGRPVTWSTGWRLRCVQPGKCFQSAASSESSSRRCSSSWGDAIHYVYGKVRCHSCRYSRG